MNTSHLELQIFVGALVTACIVGVLWWLWRRYRVRRPQKPKPSEPGK